VSSLALDAVAACCAPEAVAASARAADALVRRRAAQAAALAGVPGVTVLPGVAPYLLLRLPAGQGERVHAELRARGVAVRRGDTFPGLTTDHVRVAVRSAAQVQQLVRGLTMALAEVAA
jgi:histidinol-phosphate aminotransferase